MGTLGSAGIGGDLTQFSNAELLSQREQCMMGEGVRGGVTHKHTHTDAHTLRQEKEVLRSKALHLLTAKYSQRNPGLLLPLLCVTFCRVRRRGRRREGEGG